MWSMVEGRGGRYDSELSPDWNVFQIQELFWSFFRRFRAAAVALKIFKKIWELENIYIYIYYLISERPLLQNLLMPNPFPKGFWIGH